MQRPETVYATNFKEYFQTSRETDHPTIIKANDKNVQINYVKCNELYNGESEFKNAEDNEFYRSSRSLPSKNKMSNSEITSASTTCFESTEKRLLDFSSLCQSKRQNKKIVARSYHFSDCMEIVESSNENCKDEEETTINVYQYEKTKKITIPDKFEDFQNFKSESVLPLSQSNSQNNSSLKIITQLKDGAKLETSVHLEDSPCVSKDEEEEKKTLIESSPIVHKISIKGSRRELEIKSKMEKEFLYMTPKTNYPSKSEVNETYTVKINKNFCRSYENNQELENSYTESPAEEIQRLKRELEQKSQELRQCQDLLEDSENKTKTLENELKKKENFNSAFSNNSSIKYASTVRYTGDSNYYLNGCGEELKKELGGALPALVYLTLFMVLISKEVTKM